MPLSLRAFARVLGVDEKAVRLGVASGRLTAAVVGRDDRGRPVITDEDKARAEWGRNATKTRVATASDASRLLAVERARGLRLANDLKAGTMVGTDEVERRWARIATELRTTLLSLPARLKGRRPGLTAADVAAVDALIRETLEQLADRGKPTTLQEDA